jgi:hypothetical protein
LFPPRDDALVPCIAGVDQRVECTGIGDDYHLCGLRQRSLSTSADVFFRPLENLPAMDGSLASDEGCAR